MKKQLSIGLAATLGVLGASVFAGDEPGAEKAQMFCIYKEIVKPSKTQQYENAVKYMINEFKEYQVDPAKVNWFTVTGPELGYLYVMPIDGWSGMDTMRTAWEEAIEAVGKELNVKLHSFVWCPPDHVAFVLLEADSLNTISRYVFSIPLPQDIKVVPVEHIQDTVAMAKALLAQAQKQG